MITTGDTMDEMFCACCNRAIEAHHAWRGSAGALYCSAFCADSEYDDHLRRIERPVETAVQDPAAPLKAA
jgi:hypothetical protein